MTKTLISPWHGQSARGDIWAPRRNGKGVLWTRKHPTRSSRGEVRGGHPATYFDGIKWFRNVIDCGPVGTRMTWALSPMRSLSYCWRGVERGPGSPQWNLGRQQISRTFIYDVHSWIGTSGWCRAGTHQDDEQGILSREKTRTGLRLVLSLSSTTMGIPGSHQLLCCPSQNSSKTLQGTNIRRATNWENFVHFGKRATGEEFWRPWSPPPWLDCRVDWQFNQARNNSLGSGI
jgi:hypothetical protein